MAESITGAPPISTSTFPHSDIGLDGAHLKSPKSDPESRHQGGCGSRPGSTRGAQLACPARVLPAQEARGLGTVSSRSSVVRGPLPISAFPQAAFSISVFSISAFPPVLHDAHSSSSNLRSDPFPRGRLRSSPVNWRTRWPSIQWYADSLEHGRLPAAAPDST